MNLNAPTQVVFWIAVVVAVLAIIGFFAPTVPIIGAYAFWIAILAFVILAGGVLMKSA
jgi:hypothetical protein